MTGSHEVRGSIPLGSTNTLHVQHRVEVGNVRSFDRVIA